MPTSVLLSVRPEFAEAILSGTKEYEFRRVLFRDRDVGRVVLYATQPVGRVVGEFEVAEVISMEPHALWEATQHASGIDKSYFDQYFQGQDIAHAIRVGVVYRYPTPLDLARDLCIKHAPQSYIYVDSDLAKACH